MSLFEELIEDKELDKKIVKSFKSKETLSDNIFELTASLQSGSPCPALIPSTLP